jgi:hypothetical protein
MPRYTFERESRTPSSEAFIIEADDQEVGRVDIHYGEDIASATLCVPDDISEDEIQEIIGEVDERLVMTARPFREDFVVTVWLGRQAGVYSEEFDEELEEALEEELEGNGHHQRQ